MNFENGSELFIYGKEVEDFRTIEKEGIFSIGIAAIQNLIKRVEELENEIKLLKGG